MLLSLLREPITALLQSYIEECNRKIFGQLALNSTVAEAAHTLPCSHSTIYHTLEKNGLKIQRFAPISNDDLKVCEYFISQHGVTIILGMLPRVVVVYFQDFVFYGACHPHNLWKWLTDRSLKN